MESRNTDIIKPKKVRQSNMELLRIVAMLLVMVVHANFRALPVPGLVFTHSQPVSALLMFFTEAVSVIAVNVFVLLSGWFGIRPKGMRLGELVFQVLFFGLLAIGVCALWAPERLAVGPNGETVLSRLFMLNEGDYWFIKSYVALYLISPVLNAFVEQASKRQFATVLIAFFVFQSIFGWLFNATRWLEAGYSLPSFAALYMLARYVRLYPIDLWKRSKWFDAGMFAAYVAVLTVSMFVIKWQGGRGGLLYFYSCPLVIVGALHFVLFFSKLRPFTSRIINWVGISAFGIYLTHSNSYLYYFYDNWILGWFNSEPRMTFILYTAALIAVVFVASILIDKVRLAVWNAMLSVTERITKK